MIVLLLLDIGTLSTGAKKKKVHKRKKIKIEYEYLPQDYKDPATVICTKPTKPSKGGSGTSVWGYLTAGVVAANVAANLVNNANENNNNNNNNNNQDNTNNNNMNVGNSANMNTNMNMLLPGKRSLSTGDLIPASALRTMTGLALGSATLYTGDLWRHLSNTLSPRLAV